jgi:hypothetical protein
LASVRCARWNALHVAYLSLIYFYLQINRFEAPTEKVTLFPSPRLFFFAMIRLISFEKNQSTNQSINRQTHALACGGGKSNWGQFVPKESPVCVLTRVCLVAAVLGFVVVVIFLP